MNNQKLQAIKSNYSHGTRNNSSSYINNHSHGQDSSNHHNITSQHRPEKNAASANGPTLGVCYV